ncbi:hypothetical protein CAEBREN_07207 [Caenorhabditis brenneri]|uniref:BTB domain-containing protein n=1 Tax=Caenorhabditis brenneri TaxID=135651 RepID=G0MV28_CAEBE|nr:hypothetical protein CAEBREN_07207 [Caenorhabditis brenneri]
MSAEPSNMIPKVDEKLSEFFTLAFTKITDPYDIVLIVKERKFYCSKIGLSKHSKFFKIKFFGNSAEDKDLIEMTLEDPETPEELDTFLKVINAAKGLTDENIQGVLRLSILWKAPIAEERCLEFLNSESKKTPEEKFKLAIATNSATFKEQVLSEIKTTNDLHRIIPEDRFNWDHHTINLVFDKSLELSGWKPQPEVVPEEQPTAPMECLKKSLPRGRAE